MYVFLAQCICVLLCLDTAYNILFKSVPPKEMCIQILVSLMCLTALLL